MGEFLLHIKFSGFLNWADNILGTGMQQWRFFNLVSNDQEGKCL